MTLGATGSTANITTRQNEVNLSLLSKAHSWNLRGAREGSGRADSEGKSGDGELHRVKNTSDEL